MPVDEQISRPEGQSSTDWFDGIRDGERSSEARGTSSIKGLPLRLAALDVDDILPRFSSIVTLTAKSFAGDPLSSQKSVDLLMNNSRLSDSGTALASFVGYADGTVKASVASVFDKSFRHPGSTQRASRGILHCATPSSNFHGILRAETIQAATGNDSEEDAAMLRSKMPSTLMNLRLDLFQMPFSASGGPHAQVVIQKAVLLENLNVYLRYAAAAVSADWKCHSMLPARFMASINETLAEKEEGPLEQNLYHLAMTGHSSPTITEWLRDELAERVIPKYIRHCSRTR